MGLDVLKWIQEAQDGVEWRILVNTVIVFLVP